MSGLTSTLREINTPDMLSLSLSGSDRLQVSNELGPVGSKQGPKEALFREYSGNCAMPGTEHVID
jgi:hypothetical protein